MASAITDNLYDTNVANVGNVSNNASRWWTNTMDPPRGGPTTPGTPSNSSSYETCVVILLSFMGIDRVFNDALIFAGEREVSLQIENRAYK